jgi:hypothetical protein
VTAARRGSGPRPGRATNPTKPDEEHLMKLRLHDTSAECAVAAAGLRRTPGLHILDQSRPYPDRTGELARIYLTAHLDIRSGQPGARAGGGGGRRR